MTYTEELVKKKFIGNVVIRFLGQYFSIRQPDSGLSIPSPYNRCVRGLILNATQVDLQRANQTIANYSFRLVDVGNVITALVKDRADALINQEVEIWVGRVAVGLDFADYFKLPITKIKKVDHSENAYFISTSETTDRMSMPVFDLTGKLEDSVLDATTTFTLIEPTTDFPSSGTGKIQDEFFSWASKNDGTRTLNGILRGLKGTTAVAHSAGNDISWVYDVSENPIDILLKILISGGGGGPYDVYPDGLGISPLLIDVAGIEAIRDAIFAGEIFSFSLYDIDNALKFIENEILLGCNLRIITSDTSQISLALLDQSVFGDAPSEINEDTIASYPKWVVDDNKIVNVIEIQWDWNEGTQNYLEVDTYKDSDSITSFGERKPYKIKLKGPKSASGGQAIVDDRSTRFLSRFATPNPEITFRTHIDKSLLIVGEKVLVQSSQIPYASGTLQFATELEVISRAINFETGDVNFKLAFTSYSGIRPCYIAPSDVLFSVISQKSITVPTGRGAYYSPGWVMKLWDIAAIGYTADLANTIESIVGDTINFVNDWTTPLFASNYRMKFADYNETTMDQHRYCFISDNGNNFDDGSGTYRITF